MTAGVVDEVVDAAAGFEYRLDRRTHLDFFADVANVDRYIAAGLGNLLLNSDELLVFTADPSERCAKHRNSWASTATDDAGRSFEVLPSCVCVVRTRGPCLRGDDEQRSQTEKDAFLCSVKCETRR